MPGVVNDIFHIRQQIKTDDISNDIFSDQNKDKINKYFDFEAKQN